MPAHIENMLELLEMDYWNEEMEADDAMVEMELDEMAFWYI